MADLISYSTLFGKVEGVLNVVNAIEAAQTTASTGLEDLVETLLGDLDTSVQKELQAIAGIHEFNNSMQEAINQLKVGFVDASMLRILQSELADINLLESSLDQLLDGLIRAMEQDAYYVTGNTIPASAEATYTPAGYDAEDIVHLVCSTKDINNFVEASADNNQLCPRDTVVAEFLPSSFDRQETRGTEVLELRGTPRADSGSPDWDRFGEREYLPVISPISQNLLTNPSFDTQTDADEPPDNWEMESGSTWDTDVKQNTTTTYCAVVTYPDNGYSMKMCTEAKGMYQDLSKDVFRPGKYILGGCVYRKFAGANTAEIEFELDFGGGTTVTCTVSVSAGADGWVGTPAYKIFNIPEKTVFASDTVRFTIHVNTLTAGDFLYVDNVFLAPMTKLGGVYWAAVMGVVPPVYLSHYSLALNPSQDKVYTTFFSRYYGKPLPVSGSNLITEPA